MSSTPTLASSRRPLSLWRVFLVVIWSATFALWLWLLLDGLPYYLTPLVERPRHPGYWELKPGGSRGLLLGFAGTLLMVLMLSYLARKRMRFLRGAGPMRRWLDFHIYCGVFGPLFIVLHTSFKVGGLVAVAFWSMVAVALSGVLGRYLYVQFPRRRSGDALTLAEIETEAEAASGELQRLGAGRALLDQVDALAIRGGGPGLLRLLVGMPFAGLALHFRLSRLLAASGLPGPSHRRVAALARRRAYLARRIALWERLQRLFHWWHVIHRPFAVLLYLFLAVHIGGRDHDRLCVRVVGWLLSRCLAPAVGPAAGLLLSVFVLLGIAAPATAQLSPGALSDAHAELDGSGGCFQCHAPRRGVAAEKCLDCHDSLRQRIAARKGLHAGTDYRACGSCHIEHHGRDFDLVFWGEAGRNAFDHRLTGWPLAGAHDGVECRDCHRPERVADSSLRASDVDLQRTFLGLSTACTACHQDEHRGQFAARSCTDCHGLESWRPPARFDHSDTDFPLAGGHLRVDCESCHREEPDPVGGETFQRFTGVEFGSCAECHADPHGRQFAGRACSSCHSVDGWHLVRGFDHQRTRFPLTGRHLQVGCGDCHSSQRRSDSERASRLFRGLEFGSCSDCHTDPHRGRQGEVCASCHSTAAWGTVDLDDFDHDRTRFPLRGDHARVGCGACHGGSAGGGVAVAIAGRRLTDLTEAALDRCATCHADPHDGQLATPAGGCAECHTVEGFLPSTFGVDAHEATDLPLAGAHLAVPCDACHAPIPSQRPARDSADAGPTTRFRFASTRCASCHADPHGGEVDRWLAAGGCESCHRVEEWRAVQFDHLATRFALDGAHVGAPCRACHGLAGDRGAAASGTGGLRFRGLSTTCAGCHGDPHAGQLTGALAGGSEPALSSACTRCHRSTQAWADLSFDHSRDAAFALEGAHARLACAACHRTESAGDRAFIRYKPLPKTCAECHASTAAGFGGEIEGPV